MASSCSCDCSEFDTDYTSGGERVVYSNGYCLWKLEGGEVKLHRCYCKEGYGCGTAPVAGTFPPGDPSYRATNCELCPDCESQTLRQQSAILNEMADEAETTTLTLALKHCASKLEESAARVGQYGKQNS